MRIARRDTQIKEGDLTPVIDMAFQLIAFFMILINFSQVERTEEIELPKSMLAKPPVEPPEFQIRLNLTRDGSVLLAGEPVERISMLKPYLDREVDDAQRQGVEPPEIKVIIRSHKDTKMGIVNELVRKCQESGLESFVFRVKEKLVYAGEDPFS